MMESKRSGGASTTMRLARRPPELGFFWIRFWPREWPGPTGYWTHLANAGLGRSPAVAETAGLPSRVPEDLLYLPPVPATLRGWRDDVAGFASSGGVSPLVQLRPGDPAPAEESLAVYDPLQVLLKGRLDGLSEVPQGCGVVWPLIPGLTDDEEQWAAGCEALAAAGVGWVQPQVLVLSAGERRGLLADFEGGDRSGRLFDSLFHGPPPRERDFARCAHGHGLVPFFDRPPVRDVGRHRRNRDLVTLLALAAELWQRLGRSPATAQAFFRGARWIEGCGLDVAALAAEGNLEVVEPLDPPARELIETWVETAEAPLIEELQREYLSP